MSRTINSDNIIEADSADLPDNMLGVGVSVNRDREIRHSGIFIRYNESNYFLHFDGEKVELMDVPIGYCYYFKSLNIAESLIPSYYNYFKLVERFAKPKYGYYYSGGFYHETSLDFIDENSMLESMSCVGFCLSVLKTCFFKNDFIFYEDWQFHDGVTDDEVLKHFRVIEATYPDVTIDIYKKNARRIRPIEYFTAGFDKTANRPVRKLFTDKFKEEVQFKILEKAS